MCVPKEPKEVVKHGIWHNPYDENYPGGCKSILSPTTTCPESRNHFFFSFRVDQFTGVFYWGPKVASPFRWCSARPRQQMIWLHLRSEVRFLKDMHNQHFDRNGLNLRFKTCSWTFLSTQRRDMCTTKSRNHVSVTFFQNDRTLFETVNFARTSFALHHWGVLACP